VTTNGAGSRIRVAANHYIPALAGPAFPLRKLAYLRRLRRNALDAPAAEVADYVSALRRDGIVIVPNFIDADTIAAMRRAVPDETAFVVSEEGDRALFYHDAGSIGAFAPFFGHPIIRETAQAYISANAISLREEVCLKVVHGDVLCFEQFPHIDTWKMRLKAFLYLEDVGEDNGPMIYYKGSHRGLWRLPMEARVASWYRTDPQGFAVPEDYYLGCFWPHEVQRLVEAHGYRETICTGSAGTLLMFNGRGLHRATPLHSGRRLILASYWIHRGDHT
jgi:ectoine hydroxylase-related dioxygenase (phytanoyl-CoA dioxygenase family)